MSRLSRTEGLKNETFSSKSTFGRYSRSREARGMDEVTAYVGLDQEG